MPGGEPGSAAAGDLHRCLERVTVHYRQGDQRELGRVGLPEIRAYVVVGEFPEGSMGPKIRAAIEFLEHGGEEVIITSLGAPGVRGRRAMRARTSPGVRHRAGFTMLI